MERPIQNLTLVPKPYWRKIGNDASDRIYLAIKAVSATPEH